MITIQCQSNVSSAIQLYTVALGKTLADVCNRALGQVMLQASWRTPKMRDIWPVRWIDEPVTYTKRGKVKKRSRGIDEKRKMWEAARPSSRTVNAALKSRGIKATFKNTGTIGSSTGLFYALARKQAKGLRGSDLSNAARRIWSKRHYADGYTGMSWIPALAIVAPKYIPKVRGSGRWKSGTKGRAKQAPAGAVLATQQQLVAKAISNAPHIVAIGKPAVYQAIPIVAADMRNYAIQKLTKMTDIAVKRAAMKFLRQ